MDSFSCGRDANVRPGHPSRRAKSLSPFRLQTVKLKQTLRHFNARKKRPEKHEIAAAVAEQQVRIELKSSWRGHLLKGGVISFPIEMPRFTRHLSV